MPAARLVDAPIVFPRMFPDTSGANINGPSLIEAPDWLPRRLGRFYLYFAHHRGRNIRLAYADSLTGPWRLHLPGTLQLADASGCHDHIASPDVHVDHERREVVMYFHGMVAGGREQRSFRARSGDGIDFSASDEPIADFYLRVVPWRNRWVGMSKGGVMYVAESLNGPFDRLPHPAFPMRDPQGNAPGDVRHVALDPKGDRLDVYYSAIGDSPERILRAAIDLAKPMNEWSASRGEPVLAPERPWEGAGLPRRPSRAGPAPGPENALRDPAIFRCEGRVYLLYSSAGESGIGIAEVSE